jgi:MerR family transcriptional regulator, copper efflux regulator
MSSSHRHLTLIPGEPLAQPSVPEASRPGGEVSEEELLQVGDLARAVGKTVRAIHLYEELGLLKAHERSKGRYRLFTSDAIVRVRWIGKLQSLGLSLTEIQGIERARNDVSSAQSAAARLRELYQGKLLETRAKIDELRALETELVASLDYLAGCNTACESEVKVECCPSCERHPETPPELVAGANVH